MEQEPKLDDLPEATSLKGKRGTKKIVSAFFNSMHGIQVAWRHESAFREELLLTLFMSTVTLFLPVTALERTLLIGVWVGVLIVELLNSAIEAVVDLASPQWHALAKRAKDIASAAVFLSLLLAMLVWLGVLISLWGK